MSREVKDLTEKVLDEKIFKNHASNKVLKLQGMIM